MSTTSRKFFLGFCSNSGDFVKIAFGCCKKSLEFVGFLGIFEKKRWEFQACRQNHVSFSQDFIVIREILSRLRFGCCEKSLEFVGFLWIFEKNPGNSQHVDYIM